MNSVDRFLSVWFLRLSSSNSHCQTPHASGNFSVHQDAHIPDLTDAAKSQGRANVRGVQNNFIFIDYRHCEDDDGRISDRGDGGSSSSKQNTYEVEMIWKIVRYLAQQGYRTDNLVVLTPYLGQLSRLRDVLKNDSDPVLNDLDSHDLIRAGLLSPTENKAKRRIRLATIGMNSPFNPC